MRNTRNSQIKPQARKGASALGYGLVVGLIAVVSIGAITSVGGNVDSLFTGVADNLEDSANGTITLPAASASASSSPISVALPNCQAHRDAGSTADGTYEIDPDGSGGLPSFDAYCDMDGSDGWTLIARNTAAENGSETWNVNWATYKAGFGGVASGSRSTGWMGLDRMSALTQGGMDLQIREPGASPSVISEYLNFSINDESDNYRLNVTNGPSSDASFGNNHDGMQFTTTDRDNDTWPGTCANNGYKSGWWYYGCWAVVLHADALGTGSWMFARDLEMWVK